MSIIALSGTILNAERNKIGFLFWLVSNLYMAIRFYAIGEYAQMVLFFVYFLLAIKGIIVWEAKDKQEEKNKQTAEKVREYISKHT
jgi:nicotinamide riboside transporter PnuC